MQVNWSSLQVDLGYTKLFDIPALTSVAFKTCEGFLGALCSSVKQIKAPYLFDWKQGIALNALQVNRISSLSEGKDSWFSSSCGGNVWYILELRHGQPLTTFDFSTMSGLRSS